MNVDEDITRSLHEVASKLAFWTNVEGLYLATQRPEVSNNLKELKSRIVDVYKVSLEWQVEMMRKDGLFGIEHRFKTP